MPLGSKAWRC